MRVRLARLLPLAGAVGLLAAPQVFADATDDRLRSLLGQLGQGTPTVRIGLAHAHRITVSGRGAFRILDAETGKSLWKPRFKEEIQVVAEGGPIGGVDSVYRIQVGAFTTRESAEQELVRLSADVGAEGVVRHDPDRGNWRVRLGLADKRLALGGLMDRLRERGMQGLWIAEEAAEAVGDIRLRLVDGSYDSFPTGLSRIVVVPASGGRLSVDDEPYRGLIELRVSPFGTVRPVNWVGLERYLLGVVPAELGPEVWPELAALKAQAVAARTYVWRNRGQFADEGFDLCATPRCQVYKGAAAEHPLSDRAVWSTQGQVVTWEGEPIIALYTATCGGHTENGGNIFGEHDEPYLRGVPCRAESDAAATLGATLSGRVVRPVMDETGRDISRDWALLAVSGVLPGGLERPEQAAATLDAASLHECTTRLARLAGLGAPAAVAGAAGNLGQAAASLLAGTGWSERARVLLSQEDLPALLRDDAAAAGLGAEERRALAYLARVDALRPFPAGGYRPELPATLGRLTPALVRIGDSYEAFGLARGVVSGLSDDGLRLVRGKGSVRRPLAADVVLVGRSGGKPVPVERLTLWPNDRVRYRTNAAGAIDFLELNAPVNGVADDRSSRVFTWEVRKSRRKVEAAINRRVSIGRLQDLRVVRRGVSGRVVELEVTGTQGSATVRGFDVRRLLDLRESLLVIEVQRDANGTIEAVVFAGKGWGHGVGLCQVGAYGMALRGASYREILAHYYSGTVVQPLRVGRR